MQESARLVGGGVQQRGRKEEEQRAGYQRPGAENNAKDGVGPEARKKQQRNQDEQDLHSPSQEMHLRGERLWLK